MRTKIASLCIGGLAFVSCLSRCWANPVGGSVVGGSANATISGQGTPLTTIRQSANQAVINWQNFSIARGEVTRFVQPSATAIALNRVVSGNPSEIYGSLQANGRVFVINPNGILVGASGQIDTKGFIASTLDTHSPSFGRGTTLTLSGNSTAGIRNEGSIQALGGDVYLIAHTVENSGSIRAPQGTVGLAAGSQVQLVQAGNEHISVLAGNPAATAAAGVHNAGTVEAASAELKAAGGNIYALAINNEGVVRANHIVNENGRIYLRASGGNIQNSGTLSANSASGSGGTVIVDGGHNAAGPATVVNIGTISARGEGAGGKGGTVEVLGDHVALNGQAVVDVSGNASGGQALIGGDAHGANAAVQNALRTYVGPNALVKADALATGNGGKVVVWADDVTAFYGTILARGGASGGNGGLAEVSGLSLRYDGKTDLRAPNGLTGTLLLDPKNIMIQTGGLDPISGNQLFADNSAGTVSIDPAAIVSALGSANLVLQANTDISIKNTIDASANANSFALTLEAGRSISLSSSVQLNLKGAFNATVNHHLADPLNRDPGAAAFTMASGSSITAPGGISIQADALAAASTGDFTITALSTMPAGAAAGVDAGNISIVNNVASSKNITISGALNASGSSATALNQNGGNGGTITLDASGTLSAGAITTIGGNGNGAGLAGNGGNVSLSAATATSGLLTAGTLILAGGGNVASSGTPLNTKVDTLVLAKSGGNAFINEADALTLHGSTAGNLTLTTGGDIGIDAGFTAPGGLLTANSGNGTLTLTGAGDIGTSGARINTKVVTLVDNKNGGTAFINENNGLNLHGTFTGGGLDLLDAATTTLDMPLTGGGSDSVSLSGAVSGSSLLTVGTLTLAGSGAVGSSGTPLSTKVDTLVMNKTSGNAFVNESDGVNVHGSTAGNLTLATPGDIVIDGAFTAAGGLLTANGGSGMLTLTGAGDVGSSGAPINTTVATLTLSKSGGDSFIDETDATMLRGSTVGNLTLTTGGNILIDAGFTAAGGLLTANSGNGTLTLSGIGDVGASGARINTKVATLVDNKSGGTAFINENNGLNLHGTFTGGGLDLLDATTTTLDMPLTGGASDSVSLSGAVSGSSLLTVGTLTLAGSGAVGSSGTPLSTKVDTLAMSKISGNAFINESDGVTLHGSTAGNLTLATPGDIVIDAGFAAAGGLLTANGGSGMLTLTGAGDVGSSGTPINSKVAVLALSKSSGDSFINETDSTIVRGSTVGNLTLSAGADIVIDAAFSAGGGLLTANSGNGTLTLTGFGDVGASGIRINTRVATLVDNKSGGTAFLSEGASGLNLHGTFTGGGLDLLDAGMTTLDMPLTGGASDSVSLSGAVSGSSLLTVGTLTLAGSGAVGSSVTPLSTKVDTLVMSKSAGATFVNESDGVNIHGSTLGNLTVATPGDIVIDAALTAAGGLLTANNGNGMLTLTGVGDVGSSGTPINTKVATVALSKIGGDSFIHQADGVTLHGSTVGNLTLTAGGDILIDAALGAGGGLLTANGGSGTLTLSGIGDVGAIGARINTTVATLVDTKSGGTAFIHETDGLNLNGTFTGSSLDLLDDGTTIVDAALTAGNADSLALGGTVNGSGLVTVGMLTLNGAGDVGSSGSRLNTTVGTLVDNKSGGTAFIHETDGLNLHGAMTGSSLDLLDDGTTTLDAALTGGNLDSVTLSGAVNGPGLLAVGTLSLNAAGDVGSGGSRLNTTVATLVDNKNGGTAFIHERDGLNLHGAMSGSSLDLLDDAATTLDAALTAGNADTVTLGGAVNGSGLLTVGTLILSSSGDVGAGGSRLNTTVGTLVDNKSGGTAFIHESDGLNLHGAMSGSSLDLLDDGTTTLDAALTAGNADSVTLSGAVTGSGVLTVGTLTLSGAGDVGSSGSLINTMIDTLVLNKSAGDSFLNEGDGLTLHGSTAGNLALTAGADIAIDAALSVAGGLLTANGGIGTLTLTGLGEVGASGSRLNTTVGTLVDNKSGGTAFIHETDGLNLHGAMSSSLDLLDDGITTLDAALTAGNADSVTLSGAVNGSGLLTVGTLTLSGAGDVGSSGSSINTMIDTLVLNKTGGDSFLNEGDGLTLHGSTAGNLALTAGADIAIDAALSVAGGLLTANGGLGTLTLTGAGDVGASGSRLNTTVGTLVDNKSGGTAFIQETDGLNLHGTFSGGGLDLVDAGTTTLDMPLAAGNADSVTLGGAVSGSGLLTAGTLTLNGAGNVGSSGSSINTMIDTLVLNKSSGDSFLNEADGLTLHGSTAGNVTLAAGTDVTIDAALSAAGGLLTAHGGLGTLTLTGAGDVGASGSRLNTTVGTLVDNKSGGTAFIQETDGLNLHGTFSGGGLDLVDAGTTTLDMPLAAGNADSVTLGGAVSGSGLLTAGTLVLNGIGDVGASGAGNALNTKVNTITLAKTSGNSFINQDSSTTVDIAGTTGGSDLTLSAGPTTVSSLDLGQGTLTFNGGGTLTVNNNISAGAIIDSKATTFNRVGGAQTVTTTGDQNYTGPVTLAADTTLNSGSLELATVTASGQSLTLNNTGPATLSGPVSGIGQLTASGAGSLTLKNTISAASISDGEATTFSGVAGLETVTTSGDQNYTKSLTLAVNTILRSDTMITFGDTVSGSGVRLTLLPMTQNRDILLGEEPSPPIRTGHLTLTPGSLARITLTSASTPAALQIGDATQMTGSGNITINKKIDLSNIPTLSLRSIGTITELSLTGGGFGSLTVGNSMIGGLSIVTQTGGSGFGVNLPGNNAIQQFNAFGRPVSLVLQPSTVDLGAHVDSFKLPDPPVPGGDINKVPTVTLEGSGGKTLSGLVPAGSQILVSGGAQPFIAASSAASAAGSVVAIPVPRLDTTTINGSIAGEDAAKLKPPGSISVLFLEVPFTAEERKDYKVEDISKWTSGRVGVAGTTAGPQEPK